MRSWPIIRESVLTRRRNEMINITALVGRHAAERKIESGVAVVFVPHTTAGVTINENADPDVQHDLLRKLEELVPERERYYQHSEGNSDSHVKASLVGSSATVLIENGRLALGTWQAIYLCEFDGPRERQVMVKVVEWDGGTRSVGRIGATRGGGLRWGSCVRR
jgi:secondary thiamine-phosphate synthase enzyme